MIMRKNNTTLKLLNNVLIDLPTPSNISYMWNFGSLLGICLVMQLVTGIFLSFHYNSSILLAFDSVNHIMRDVNFGWLLRIIHANGASLFFFLVYIHIGRGLYYSSFHFMKVWSTGLLILFILMATAFLGYVLPWGQMSFWGATVITNLLSAIPYIGNQITFWIWGGFSVDSATLSRFFSLHFLLPFSLVALLIFHIMFLHETGSSNPLGISFNIDKLMFHPYYSLKDLLGLMSLLMVFTTFILIFPYLLIDPENFIMANAMVTPPHIQPEWYFLFAYAILRSIPNKLGGVIALFLSIAIIMTLPFSMKNKFSPIYFYPMLKYLFWNFINIFLILTFIGACPVEEPYVMISQILTFLYFLYFLLLPLSTLLSFN